MDLEDLRERSYTLAEDFIDVVFDFLEGVFESQEDVDFPYPFNE